MTDRARLRTVDGYLAAAEPRARVLLETLRAVVQRTVPDATECISYRMPAFRRGKVFIYFAAFRHHLGVYPPVPAGAGLDDALAPFRGPRGNLRFPLERDLPVNLIARLARALADAHRRATSVPARGRPGRGRAADRQPPRAE